MNFNFYFHHYKKVIKRTLQQNNSGIRDMPLKIRISKYA